MQRKRRMLTASRLCLLGIAVSASSFSVFAQCPNDTNCDAVVRSIWAVTNSYYGVYGSTAAGFPLVYAALAMAWCQGGKPKRKRSLRPINEPK